MEDVPIERIRNVVLLSHNGAGTTTLAEALMARAGATARLGSVDAGTSVLDSDPESVKRKMSLSLSLAPFRWTATDGLEYQVNLIDVPGYADFVGAAEAAMAVADLAVLVVSAVDGVEVQTEMLWRRAVARGLPRMVFVTKEDRERADFHRVLQQLQTMFGSGFAPLELPIGEAQSLHGIADVLSEQAFEYEPGGKHHVEPMPADIADEEHRLHDSVVEEIVSGDDDQLERYLSGEVPSVEDLERTLRHEVLDCLEFPVMLGSAATGVGIDRLADFICELGPSPADRPFTVQAGGQPVEVTADPAAAPLLHVFATVADPYVGQLSLFKVLTGKIKADDVLHNPRSGSDEKLHNLFSLRGREQTPITRVGAGNIAAVSRLGSTRTFDTLTTKATPVHVSPPPMPVPQYAVAIVPRTQADDDKLGVALAKLQAEDPVLMVSRDDETHQTVLRAMGDTHVSVTLERLSRLFGVQVDTEPLRIAYRETIAGNATVEGKLKKQSGGHGQFAIANLRVAPLPRGSGFEFVDAVVGGAIPRNLVPAVQRGIEEALVAGGPYGYPIVDIRVECFDGKFHPVDSSEMAFKTAAALGLHDALASAGTVVLEPIAEVRVAVPPSQQGDVMGDLTSRRGRVMGTDVGADGQQTIVAHVPAAEIARYAVDLRSITGGRGEYTASHDHYDVLPEPLAAKLPRPQGGRRG